jgi:hypothetical protein
MQSLSPEARARLAAFHQAESPDAAAELRVLAAIERRIAEPAPRRRIVVPLVTALALAAALLLVLRWAIVPADRSDDAAVQAPYHDAPPIHEVIEEAPPVRVPVIVPEPAPAAATLEEPVEQPPVPSVTSPTKRPRAREASADDIAAEVALLREAKLATPARRLELLGEHARRFPNGAFAAERGLLEVETRCDLGETDEARALAARFAQRFPGSPLVARAAKICSEDPTP